MSLLSYYELCRLVESGHITADINRVNGASIDVTLGEELLIERTRPGGVIDLANKECPAMKSVQIGKEGYALNPGQFALASTQEVFNLPPTIACEFKLKSSTARAGLDNALATWCDPTWTGSVLTLELRNNLEHHRLLLRVGMKVGQMVFFSCAPVPHAVSYAQCGQYNGDLTTTASRGVR